MLLRSLWILLLLLALLGWVLPAPVISTRILSPPDATYWLGTDALGQSVALLMLKALPSSLMIAALTGLLPVVFALLLASLALPAPRWLDVALLKITDVLMLLPATLLLILLAALVEPGLWGSILLISALAWMDDFRLIRSTLQREALRDNVQMARSYGASSFYLLRVHLWPRLPPVLFALCLQNARRGVLLSAGLAFLGLADPRLPSWGGLMFEAREYIHTPAFWWLLLPPVFALALFMLLLNRLERRQDVPHF